MTVHTILFVHDQSLATEFYQNVLGLTPRLFVPGMTEFLLSENHVLGLMPEVGIKKILGATINDPSEGRNYPRAELYVRVDNPSAFLERALEKGAKLLSPLQKRNWGDEVGYLQDLDGHILAFSSP